MVDASGTIYTYADPFPPPWDEGAKVGCWLIVILMCSTLRRAYTRLPTGFGMQLLTRKYSSPESSRCANISAAFYYFFYQPSLSYIAPELVAGWGPAVAAAAMAGPRGVSPAADVFSLALIAAEVLPSPVTSVGRACGGGKVLLPVRSNVNEYRTAVGVLPSVDIVGLPLQLQGNRSASVQVLIC